MSPLRTRRRLGVLVGVLLLLASVGAVVTAQVTSATADSFALPSGEVLAAGQSITSPDGDYQFVEQSDGNLVENSLYGIAPIWYASASGTAYFGGGNTAGGVFGPPDKVQIWQARTAGHPGAEAIMQTDGNLVVYSSSRQVLWSSNTAGNPGAHLAVQTDANVVVYSSSGRALWQDGTASTTDSGSTDYSTVRDCPIYAAASETCNIQYSLPNGTAVTMLCWESTDFPVAARPPQPPSAKWFYVKIDNGQYAGADWFINAELVDNQIATPGCIPIGSSKLPVAPSVNPGTAPASSATAPGPTNQTSPTTPAAAAPGQGQPSAVLSQGSAASAGYWYSVSLSGFTADAKVSVTCYDSVSPGGFRTFSVQAGSDGSATTASGCYSGDGPDHWVRADSVESNHVTWDSAPVSPVTNSPLPAATTYPETVGGVTHTWTDYSNAGGYQGQSIQTDTTVAVTCKIQGFKVQDGDTWWYRIASNPWVNQYYASADAFFNNRRTSGSLLGTPFVDASVPDC